MRKSFTTQCTLTVYSASGCTFTFISYSVLIWEKYPVANLFFFLLLTFEMAFSRGVQIMYGYFPCLTYLKHLIWIKPIDEKEKQAE